MMHSDFARLGSVFRTCREQRHLSLKEVENAISIRMGYLQAIEEGEFNKLISPIYAQGFIRKYASFLELDGDQLIQEHPSLLRLLNEQHAQEQEFSYGIGSLEIRGTPGGEVKWLPNVMWVAGSVVVIVGGWLLARYFGFL